LRLFTLVAVMPPLLRWLAVPSTEATTSIGTPGNLSGFLLLLGASAAAAGLMYRMRFPGGVLLGAMMASAVLHGTGMIQGAVAVTGTTPDKVTTDKHASYPPALDEVFCDDLEHRTSKYLNNHLEQDHRGVKGRYQPMRGFQTHTSAARFCRAHDEVRDFFRSSDQPPGARSTCLQPGDGRSMSRGSQPSAICSPSPDDDTARQG
jgi:hypothetical protein